MFFFCATECCDRGNIKARVGVNKQQPITSMQEKDIQVKCFLSVLLPYSVMYQKNTYQPV